MPCPWLTWIGISVGATSWRHDKLLVFEFKNHQGISLAIWCVGLEWIYEEIHLITEGCNFVAGCCTGARGLSAMEIISASEFIHRFLDHRQWSGVPTSFLNLDPKDATLQPSFFYSSRIAGIAFHWGFGAWTFRFLVRWHGQWDFQGPPIMGPPYGKLPILFPYHSHIHRDSYGSGMGIV